MSPTLNQNRRSIYTNPSARTWQAPIQANNSIAIKQFYSNLPEFAPTRLVPLPDLATEVRVKAIYVKAETSRLGLPSFKLLGASWAIRQAIIQRAFLPSTASLTDLTAAVKKHDIKLCAATDGNHGRAVARMGRLLGVQEAKIFVPTGLDEKVIASIASENAEVLVVDGDYDESVQEAHRWAEETEGGMLIEGTAFEGYEDVPKWTVEGYTTMFHEIDEQLRGQVPTLVIAPVGVGSLAEAIVTHYKNGSGATAVAAVEPDTAGSLYKSLQAGESISIATSISIMTGLECGTISTAAWPILQAGVDISTTVSDFETHEAIQYLRLNGVNAGPCGAASLAGLRRIAGDPSISGLKEDSVVVLMCTEGSRDYQIPISVFTEEVKSLTHTLLEIDPTDSISRTDNKIRLTSFVVQWLEHRDIGARCINDSSNLPAVVATLRKHNQMKAVIRGPTFGAVEAKGLGSDLELIVTIREAWLNVKHHLAAFMVAMSNA